VVVVAFLGPLVIGGVRHCRETDGWEGEGSRRLKGRKKMSVSVCVCGYYLCFVFFWSAWQKKKKKKGHYELLRTSIKDKLS
jgi:hypothetical protein